MKISPFIVGKESRSRLVRKLTVGSADSDIVAHSLGSQHPRSCLKVTTQMESLAKVATVAENRKMVRFASVEFREYTLVLSDNPSTTSGPPIGIGWKYYPEDTVLLDLDEYERGREGRRRTARELSLPPDVRDNMLRNIGYSRKELLEAVRIVGKDKYRRRISLKRQKFEPIIEYVESVRVGIKWLIS